MWYSPPDLPGVGPFTDQLSLHAALDVSKTSTSWSTRLSLQVVTGHTPLRRLSIPLAMVVTLGECPC